MTTQSVWEANSLDTDFPQLETTSTTEVLIIGGGITGITLAAQLADSGQSSIVLEADKVGRNTTGHSTGNLYEVMDTPLTAFIDKYDKDTVKNVLSARKEALMQIQSDLSKYDIDADKIVTSWYYCDMDKEPDKIQEEYELATMLGLDAALPPHEKIPLKITSAMAIKDQMQINPLKYVQQLAIAIPKVFVEIYEHSPVTEIKKVADGYQISTSNGSVHAQHLVHATHTPKGVFPQQTLLGPYREYGIACSLLRNMDFNGIFWINHNREKYSVRFYEQQGQQYLLVIGKRHKVGQQSNNAQCLDALIQFARENFPVSEVIYKWGGQHYRPADLLPYIGETDERQYIATGYATDGLIYGTLASMLIKDQILGIENPWSVLFKPDRFTPVKSAKSFLKENLNVAAKFLERLPDLSEDKDFADIVRGEGRVVDKDSHKLAVYRAADKKLVVKSAICPHLGCVVHFNAAEQTWDCPCHGSRFSTDGDVLEGPALDGLRGITGKDGKVHIDK